MTDIFCPLDGSEMELKRLENLGRWGEIGVYQCPEGHQYELHWDEGFTLTYLGCEE